MSDLGPYVRWKNTRGRALAYCVLCRGAAFMSRSPEEVAEAFAEHLLTPRHSRSLRKAGESVPQ